MAGRIPVLVVTAMVIIFGVLQQNANSLVKIWDKVQIEECIYAYYLTAMGTMVIIRAMELSDYC